MILADRTAELADFVEVPVELLQRESKLEFDLYLRGPRGMVLYREQRQPFSHAVANRLVTNGVTVLWVSDADEQALGHHVEKHIDEILEDPTLPPPRKAHALYTASRSLAMDLLTNPDDEKLRRTRPLVAKTVSAIMGDPRILSALLATLASRYQVHSHCVNVSVYTTAFARQMGHRDLGVLTEFALGGMLHDLGKSRISEAILDKPGPLNEREWEIMRMHPGWGVELLGSMGPQLGRVTQAVISHHEQWDGGGYPNGLAENNIPLAGRIVAIADSFDALTTERTYRDRMSPFDALVVMRDELAGKFDRTLLQRFISVWGPNSTVVIN